MKRKQRCQQRPWWWEEDTELELTVFKTSMFSSVCGRAQAGEEVVITRTIMKDKRNVVFILVLQLKAFRATQERSAICKRRED